MGVVCFPFIFSPLPPDFHGISGSISSIVPICSRRPLFLWSQLPLSGQCLPCIGLTEWSILWALVIPPPLVVSLGLGMMASSCFGQTGWPHHPLIGLSFLPSAFAGDTLIPIQIPLVSWCTHHSATMSFDSQELKTSPLIRDMPDRC